MTDLEMTALCAEAMGFRIVYPDQADLPLCIESSRGAGMYNPLHDDAQAMALVKRFWLKIGYGHRIKDGEMGPEEWRVSVNFGGPYIWGPDLNRAIVECVANLKGRP